ncbi:MAG: undecaprenyl-diphosphate phosphatase [Xanthomonadales bacterium]|nr:undecaprenyl-diphosphate phosphatase [Xanthomonadales bacterium]NIN60124.1 undecaprenyl-diphosphate phosphatase [Xanthomonadales bacterium]NIN74271.1 undecaprenyl-diphosphate phosphatase [Xanthomonadales bacterium]NIO12780.1 undecaprenyl-diphosphate phosphatase [Xanthomonadales bacterium]NIP12517.1 undecaprenyl-diphosphate phosphatase [Xanthomonadales bacterium]
MSLLQVVVLALIQGLTEFLPVSSSAHLILGSHVFGWPDQGLVFDVATHAGTLLAVLVYFRRELGRLVCAWLGNARADSQWQGERRMGQYLVLASMPAICVGALAHEWVEVHLRDVRIIAWTTLSFGALMWAADALCARNRQLPELNFRGAMLIGLAQVLALVPGASRSGVTITMGRALGFSAESAARFSFLLSIPVIAAAGSYGLWRMFTHAADIAWSQFGLAVLFSAVAGWVCIAVFLALLRRVGLLPFVVYRLAIGFVLLSVLR